MIEYQFHSLSLNKTPRFYSENGAFLRLYDSESLP